MRVFAKQVDMHELHRPCDAAFEIAEINFTDRERGLRQLGQVRALSHLVEQPDRSQLRFRMERNALADAQQKLWLSACHRAERAQGADANPRFGRTRSGAENRQHALDFALLHHVVRNMRERVHQREQIFAAAEENAAIELIPISAPLLGHAARKKARRDGLERVGNACCVLLRNLIIRVQTQLDIIVPQRDALAQHRVQRGRDGERTRPARQLFSVARAGIGEDCAHDAPRVAAHVAIVMHQKLVEKAQGQELVRARHVGAVFFKQQ